MISLLNGLNKRLDFVVVGVQKAGTSALDSYFRMHPSIGLAEKKELHFFDKKTFRFPMLYEYYRYHKNFNFNSAAKVYGEITPSYIYIEDCPERLFEYNPNIKIIVMLRNPITRAYSHYNMEVDRQIEDLPFEIAIEREADRLRQASTRKEKRAFSYTDRGFYAAQIERYLKFFSLDQMKILRYEDYLINQEKNLRAIFDFLEIEQDVFTFKSMVSHKRKYHNKLTPQARAKLMSIYAPEIGKIEKLLNWDCSDWLE